MIKFESSRKTGGDTLLFSENFALSERIFDVFIFFAFLQSLFLFLLMKNSRTRSIDWIRIFAYSTTIMIVVLVSVLIPIPFSLPLILALSLLSLHVNNKYDLPKAHQQMLEGGVSPNEKKRLLEMKTFEQLPEHCKTEFRLTVPNLESTKIDARTFLVVTNLAGILSSIAVYLILTNF